MSFQELISSAQKYFPDLQIKYKNQSLLMKIIGTLLFFNKEFMTTYTTTLGSTVYVPNETYLKIRPVSGTIIVLHELVHIYDSKKLNKFLFSFLYLSPQIFVLLCLPLFLISWKLALPLLILFALPLPSYFRMYFEKRAYLASLYCLNALGQRLKFDPHLDKQNDYFLSQFKGSYYYYMWIFNNIKNDFNDGVTKIKSGLRPYDDHIFDILDDLITKI